MSAVGRIQRRRIASGETPEERMKRLREEIDLAEDLENSYVEMLEDPDLHPLVRTQLKQKMRLVTEQIRVARKDIARQEWIIANQRIVAEGAKALDSTSSRSEDGATELTTGEVNVTHGR